MDRAAELIDAAVERLREREPDAIALLVAGSYAKGTADELSDLDLTAVVEQDADRYHTWFAERDGQRPLHVSAGVRTVSDMLARRETPADWWLGVPVLEVFRYAWATEAARAILGDDPSIPRPAAEPELEDFFEFAVKARRAVTARDTFAIRVWVRSLGALAPRLLVPLNDVAPARDRREEAETALGFAVAPAHWRDDLSACLGLRETDDASLAAAALRLPLELLAFLRRHRPDVDPLPELVTLLESGALERQLSA